MKTPLAALLLLASATAAAQPKPQTFTSVTTFEGCTTSWAFACGKRDANGRTFGTAHQMQHCQKYTFQPNGTYSVVGGMLPEIGTYKVVGRIVTVTSVDADGKPQRPFEMTLSADGTALANMKKL